MKRVWWWFTSHLKAAVGGSSEGAGFYIICICENRVKMEVSPVFYLLKYFPYLDVFAADEFTPTECFW